MCELIKDTQCGDKSNQDAGSNVARCAGAVCGQQFVPSGKGAREKYNVYYRYAGFIQPEKNNRTMAGNNARESDPERQLYR